MTAKQSQNRPPNRPGEFELIERYFAPLSGEGSFCLKDDAATLTPTPGYDLVVTQDAIHQDVHFFAGSPWSLIARRALRCNLSDIFAKGAQPLNYSVALGLPRWATEDHVADFARGLAQDNAEYGIHLSGGDTYSTEDKLTIAITMIGEVPTGRFVKRISAKPGQLICVLGNIGDATLGLAIQSKKLDTIDKPHLQELVHRQIVPVVHREFGEIVQTFAMASMDVSDGLIGDLRKMCKASGVSAKVEFESIPISNAARQALAHEPQLAGLHDQMPVGGDDYVPLFTIGEDKLSQLQTMCAARGVSASVIGTTGDGSAGEVVVLRDGVPMSFDIESYSHF